MAIRLSKSSKIIHEAKVSLQKIESANPIKPEIIETPVQPQEDPLLKMFQFAANIGVPQDAILNFLKYGIILQPKQLLMTKAARECDIPGGPTQVGVGGARGGGKSFWSVCQSSLDDCQRCPGLKVLLLRKVGKAGRESFDDLRKKILKHIKYRYRRQEGVLEFANGSTIILGHYKDEKDIDNYLGLEYGLIIIEEATTLSVGKLKAISSCNRCGDLYLLGEDNEPDYGNPWRPRTYLTTNPGGVSHAHFKENFVEPYRNHSEKETRFIPSTVDDNAFLNEDYTNILENFTGWLYEAWRHGNWDIAAGQFFTTWNKDAIVTKEPIEIQKSWMCWLAMDYGFTHFTVVYLLAKTDDGDIYVIDEHAERGWLPGRHHHGILDMLFRNKITQTRVSRFVGGHDLFSKDDEGKTTAQKYRELGWFINHANVDRIQGAAEILQRLGDTSNKTPEDRKIRPTVKISPKCVGLIRTLPYLEHDPHRPEDILKVDCDDEGNGGDDFYDAFRYGIMVNRIGSGDIDLEAAKALAGFDDEPSFSSEYGSGSWDSR